MEVVLIPEIELEMILRELYGFSGKAVFFIQPSVAFYPTPFVLRCTQHIYQHEAMDLPAHASLEALGGLA